MALYRFHRRFRDGICLLFTLGAVDAVVHAGLNRANAWNPVCVLISERRVWEQTGRLTGWLPGRAVVTLDGES